MAQPGKLVLQRILKSHPTFGHTHDSIAAICDQKIRDQKFFMVRFALAGTIKPADGKQTLETIKPRKGEHALEMTQPRQGRHSISPGRKSWVRRIDGNQSRRDGTKQ
jgi:hypothetical protein